MSKAGKAQASQVLPFPLRRSRCEHPIDRPTPRQMLESKQKEILEQKLTCISSTGQVRSGSM